MLAREPASFWRENVIAAVILLRIVARMFVFDASAILVPYPFSCCSTGPKKLLNEAEMTLKQQVL